MKNIQLNFELHVLHLSLNTLRALRRQVHKLRGILHHIIILFKTISLWKPT